MCKEWIFLCACFIWRHKLGYERLTLSVNVCVGLFNMYQPWGCIDMLSNHVYHIYVYIYAYMLEKAMATHSSTLAWKIAWIEEPGRLQSMGSLGVGHDWSNLAAAAACIYVNWLLFSKIQYFLASNSQSFFRIPLWSLFKRLVYIFQQLLLYYFWRKNVEWEFDSLCF